MIDVDINAIRLGDLVPCISTQHGIMSTFGDVSTYYLVSKYELDLENPANNKITLGRTISSLTDTVAGTNNVKGMIQALSVASTDAVAKSAAAEKVQKKQQKKPRAQQVRYKKSKKILEIERLEKNMETSLYS